MMRFDVVNRHTYDRQRLGTNSSGSARILYPNISNACALRIITSPHYSIGWDRANQGSPSHYILGLDIALARLLAPPASSETTSTRIPCTATTPPFLLCK